MSLTLSAQITLLIRGPKTVKSNIIETESVTSFLVSRPGALLVDSSLGVFLAG